MGCASADITPYAVAVGVFLKGDGIHCRARESLRDSLAVVCTGKIADFRAKGGASNNSMRPLIISGEKQV